ncbi:MAG: alkaline phosphatase D family protein [Ilumatobacteraceae bacterium]
MRPFTRRSFLAGVAALVAAGCADDERPSGSSNPTIPGSWSPFPGDTVSVRTSSAPTSASAATNPSSQEPEHGSTSVDETAATPTSSLAPLAPVDFADPFTLGVASGDPDATSVVLWTRLAPDPVHGGGMPGDDVPVRWELGRDEAFTTVDRAGDTTAPAEHAHAVHVTVELDPGDWWYRFRVGQHTSVPGRTSAAPAPDAPVDRLTFASASCQNYEAGYYAAHRDLAEQRPAFVMWLGDYIYEAAAGAAGPGSVRAHDGPEATDLDGYRRRYALYKTDTDLQAAHRACPWFVIWDDHEVQDNYAGVVPKDPAQAATFPARRAAAYQAWWEHMPVRLPAPTGLADPAAEYRTYRDAQWGDLLGLALLDGRQYRSDQACGDAILDLAPPCAELTAPGRTMLGAAQEQSLDARLGAWGTTWNVLGNQTVLTDLTVLGAVINYDQWDGYPAERAALLDHLATAAVPNVVVLTGDIHVSIVGQLRSGSRATGAPVGVEFVCSSISSGSFLSSTYAPAMSLIPDIVDLELEHRGYVLHTVTRDEWRAEYRLVTDAHLVDSPVTSHATYVVPAGTSQVHRE